MQVSSNFSCLLHISYRNTNVPPLQALLLAYSTGVMNNTSVWKCWCVSENHRGEEQWRQPLSEDDGSWRWACPPAACVCGEPESYSMFGKKGQQDGERQEGRYRKWMEGECFPMEKRCARIQTEYCRASWQRKPLWLMDGDWICVQMSLTH